MLSIFTHCKAFHGHIGTIQRNAIRSWAEMRPGCEILLFGEREGTAEVARELGIRHEPEVAKNEYGAPLLRDLLERSERLGRHELLCYINADIILDNGFMQAVREVSEWRKRFLMIGECWDVDMGGPLGFDEPDWKEKLRKLVATQGRPRGPYANDYFVFPRGFYRQVPPLALGRSGIDHWLVWKARDQGDAVVDATAMVMAIHQNHDYSHVPGGKSRVREGEEGRRNLEIAGGRRDCTLDCTHRLNETGIHFALSGYFRLYSRRNTSRIVALGWKIMELTHPIRRRLGLTLANMERLVGYVGRWV